MAQRDDAQESGCEDVATVTPRLQRESMKKPGIPPCLRLVLFSAAAAGICATGPSAGPKSGKSPGPLSPREELATFQIAKGFHVELVACEPNVIDPVAMAFDEEGRLYVAEMRGYPNGGVGTGKIASGKIRLLEDKDGDGFYETSTVYAEGLRFPIGVMPHQTD